MRGTLGRWIMTPPGLPPAVKEFRPLVYQEGNAYCCVLGPNPQAGVAGCGSSPQDALMDWNEDFKRRIQNKANVHRNEVTQFLLDSLAISKKDVW